MTIILIVVAYAFGHVLFAADISFIAKLIIFGTVFASVWKCQQTEKRVKSGDKQGVECDNLVDFLLLKD